MKAVLVLQEGPGAGDAYPLDPFRKPVLSVGRSSECDIVLDDHRCSRHHGDIRWNGRQWEVVDRGSTNGTYVNGMRVHRPYDLRVGDRVTIGETTLVLREAADGPPSAVPSRPRATKERAHTAEGPVIPAPVARPIQRPSQPIPRQHTSPAVSAAFWLVQGLVVLAVICLAAGAFLPWLRVTGTLSQDLGPLLQGITDLASYFLGTDSFLHFTQDISGLEGYGKLTLGLAVIGLAGLMVDIFYRKSPIPGILYVLASLIVAGAMASDLVNFYGLYQQAESWSLLFGIQLGDVVQIFDQFIAMEVKPLPGLPLTVAGLVLLAVGGIGRLIVALLSRNR